jgi:hypothetical protein
MPHRLDQKNQKWKDMVDEGLVVPLKEEQLAFVDDDFWEMSNKTRPVRCPTSQGGGRDLTSSLTSTGQLSKQGKRYVCVVTTDTCVSEAVGPVGNGTRIDPIIHINLTKFGPQTTPRYSMPFTRSP